MVKATELFKTLSRIAAFFEGFKVPSVKEISGLLKKVHTEAKNCRSFAIISWDSLKPQKIHEVKAATASLSDKTARET